MKTTTTERARQLKTVTYQGYRIVQVMGANVSPRYAHPPLWVVMARGSVTDSLDSSLNADPRELQACVDLVDRLEFDAAKATLAGLRGESTDLTAGGEG